MAGIERIFSVSKNILSNCYCIVDQTRPGEAISLYYSLKNDIEQKNHILFVFNGAYAPLGFIKGNISNANPDFLTANVDYLFVDKKYQRCGIGTSLLNAYEDFCAKNFVQKVSLYSAKTAQARTFYEKHGYILQNANYFMTKNLSR